MSFGRCLWRRGRIFCYRKCIYGADAKKDAIEALVALGYSASEAAGAVRKLQVTEEMSVEDILKLSLKNL